MRSAPLTSARCVRVLQVRDFDARCGSCGTGFPACVFSGRSILDPSEAAKCKGCKRSYYKSEAQRFRNCALCHTPLPTKDHYRG